MTAQKTRIYLVTLVDARYLVRATNKSQAVLHIAGEMIRASVATQDDLIAAIGAGLKVETASEPVQEAAPG